jgi:DNA invertase Pin-like site-specific DNA recombinase
MDLDQDQIISLYRDRNMSYQQIGDKFGCSHTTIGKLIRASGIKRRPVGGKSQGGGRLMYAHEREARNALIKSLWGAGLPACKIAKQLRMSQSAVSEVLDKLRIQERDRNQNKINSEKAKLLCCEVYAMGFSVAKTAEITGCSNMAVYRYIGDKLRTHAEQKQCDARAYRKDLNAVLNEAHELISKKLARTK